MVNAMNVDYDGEHFQLTVSYNDCVIGRQHGNYPSLVGEVTHTFFEGRESASYWLSFSAQAKKELGKDKVGFLEHMVRLYNNKTFREPLYVSVK